MQIIQSKGFVAKKYFQNTRMRKRKENEKDIEFLPSSFTTYTDHRSRGMEIDLEDNSYFYHYSGGIYRRNNSLHCLVIKFYEVNYRLIMD